MLGRMRDVLLFAVVLALFASVGVSAQSVGQFFRHDDSRYWWYEAHDRAYEIALPANPIYTVHKDLFGETSLELPLREGGPYLRLSSFPGGQAALDRAVSAVQAEWQHVLTGARLTENRTITTRMSLRARFIVIEGRTAAGTNGMVPRYFTITATATWPSSGRAMRRITQAAAAMRGSKRSTASRGCDKSDTTTDTMADCRPVKSMALKTKEKEQRHRRCSFVYPVKRLSAETGDGEDPQQVRRILRLIGGVFHRLDQVVEQQQRAGGQVHEKQLLIQFRFENVGFFFGAFNGGAKIERSFAIARCQFVHRFMQLLCRSEQQVPELAMPSFNESGGASRNNTTRRAAPLA